MDIYFPKTRRPMANATSTQKRTLMKETLLQKAKEQTLLNSPTKTPSTNHKPPPSHSTSSKSPTKLTSNRLNNNNDINHKSNSPIYVDLTPPKSNLVLDRPHRPVKRRILEPPGAPKKPREKPAVFRKLFEHAKQKDLPQFDLASPIKVFHTPIKTSNTATRNLASSISATTTTTNESESSSSSPSSSTSISTPTKVLKTTTPTSSPIKSNKQILNSPIKRKEFTSPLKTKTLTPSTSKIEDGPLKGISTRILEFVRAKEAATKNISPDQERRNVLLGIAPDIARIIPTIFTASRRDILPYHRIVEHCCKSLKMNYTSSTIEECLILMDTIAPEWTSTVTISRGKFMRLNRDKYTIPQLLDVIKKYKQKNC